MVISSVHGRRRRQGTGRGTVMHHHRKWGDMTAIHDKLLCSSSSSSSSNGFSAVRLKKERKSNRSCSFNFSRNGRNLSLELSGNSSSRSFLMPPRRHAEYHRQLRRCTLPVMHCSYTSGFPNNTS